MEAWLTAYCYKLQRILKGIQLRPFRKEQLEWVFEAIVIDGLKVDVDKFDLETKKHVILGWN